MELFKSSKLSVSVNDNNEFTVTQKSDETTVDTYKFSDVMEMVPNNGGSSVAIALKNADLSLKMNKTAVNRLVELWNSNKIEYTKELLFQKPNVACYITSNGYLLFYDKVPGGFCGCLSGTSVIPFSICLADVIVIKRLGNLIGKDSVFLCSERHAVEIQKIDNEVIERIEKVIKESGAKISKTKVYKRSFKLFRFRKTQEYIFTTPLGIAHYYKKAFSNSKFEFSPWDNIQLAASTKGCCKRRLMVISDFPIITECKFPADDVKDIVNYVNGHVKANAGSGKMFGKGSNKVLVTDTHVLCIGKKDLKSLKKPYESGKLIEKSWFSSKVDLDGFEVKVGRLQWKGCCCCCGGSFRDAVREEPSRKLKEDASRRKY